MPIFIATAWALAHVACTYVNMREDMLYVYDQQMCVVCVVSVCVGLSTA